MIQINTNPLVCLVIAALTLWSLDRVINPRDLNHLLLMNQSGQDLSSGTLSVEGSRADWNVDFAGCGDGRLSVKNVPHPWSGGTLMIRTDGGQQLAGAAMWCLQTRWKPAVAVPFFLLLLIDYVELDTLRTESGQSVIDELGVPAIVLRFVMLDGPLLAGSCWHWCRSPGSVQMVGTQP